MTFTATYALIGALNWEAMPWADFLVRRGRKEREGSQDLSLTRADSHVAPAGSGIYGQPLSFAFLASFADNAFDDSVGTPE